MLKNRKKCARDLQGKSAKATEPSSANVFIINIKSENIALIDELMVLSEDGEQL